MDHTPFIVGAYSAAIIILAWCALAPIARTRRLKKALRARDRQRRVSHASQA